jgi:hypothetical protein
VEDEEDMSEVAVMSLSEIGICGSFCTSASATFSRAGGSIPVYNELVHNALNAKRLLFYITPRFWRLQDFITDNY